MNLPTRLRDEPNKGDMVSFNVYEQSGVEKLASTNHWYLKNGTKYRFTLDLDKQFTMKEI